MKRNFLLAALGLLVVAASFFPLFRYTDSRRFQEDEHIFVRRGIFLDYYLAGKFFDPIWQSFDSYDVPKFGEFFYGAVLRLYFGQSTQAYLESVPLFLSPIDSPDHFWYAEYSRNSCCTIQDLPPHIQERLQPILLARKFSVFFALFSLAILFAIGWRSKSWLMGVLIVVILGQNILFKDSMTTAMGDGPLIFWSVLYALCVGLFLKYFQENRTKKYKLLFILAAISSGLATATKLNGVINVIHFLLVAQLFLHWKIDPFRVLKYQVCFVGIAYVTFFVLNPFLWTDPLRNSMFMNITRQVTIEKQQAFSEKNDQSLRTVPNRILRSYQRTLASNSYYNNFKLQPELPIDLTLFLAGGVLLFNRLKKMTKLPNFAIKFAEKTSFGVWILLWGLITTLLIPLDWDHYYLPIVLGISVLQSYTISEFLEKLLACFSSSCKIVPDQK